MELAQAAWSGGAGMFGGQDFGFGGTQAQDARLGDVDGENGTILVTSDGQTDRIPIIRVNGRWYLNGTTASGDVPAMGGESAQIVKTAMQDSINNINDLTIAVRAGEFTSIDQVQAALAAFAQQMQQTFMDQGGD